MNEAQKILLSILSRTLKKSDTPAFPANEALRRTIVEESIRQSVCLSVFDSLYDSEKDDGVAYRTLKKYADATYKNNIIGYEYHREVSDLLSENSIAHVIIKGIASDRYYPKPYLRSIGDVDLMVRPNELDSAGAVLEKNGFAKLKAASDHHNAYIKGKCRVELHHTVGDSPQSIQKAVGALFWGENGIIESADHISYGGTQIPVANSFFHCLTLLLHTAGHIKNEGIGLRHLCDWAVFVHGCDNFEEKLGGTLTELGLMKLAKVLTKTAEYIGLENSVLAKDTPSDAVQELMNDILTVGNMGTKNTNDSFANVNRNKNESAKEQSKRAYLIATLNNHVYTHLPAAKKHKILLVPGYVYVLLRRLWLRLTGKRARIDVNKNYDNAVRRDRLISSLELYGEKK